MVLIEHFEGFELVGLVLEDAGFVVDEAFDEFLDVGEFLVVKKEPCSAGNVGGLRRGRKGRAGGKGRFGGASGVGGLPGRKNVLRGQGSTC